MSLAFEYCTECACGSYSFTEPELEDLVVYKRSCSHICCHSCSLQTSCRVCNEETTCSDNIARDFNYVQLRRSRMNNGSLYFLKTLDLNKFLNDCKNCRYPLYQDEKWSTYKRATEQTGDTPGFVLSATTPKNAPTTARIELSTFQLGMIANCASMFELKYWNFESNLESVKSLLVSKMFPGNHQRLNEIVSNYAEKLNLIRSAMEGMHDSVHHIDEKRFVQYAYALFVKGLAREVYPDDSILTEAVNNKRLKSKLFQVCTQSGETKLMRLAGFGDVLTTNLRSEKTATSELKAPRAGLYHRSGHDQRHQLIGELFCIHAHGMNPNFNDSDVEPETAAEDKDPMVGILSDMIVFSVTFAAVNPNNKLRGFYLCDRVHRAEHCVLLLLLTFVEHLTWHDIRFAAGGKPLTIETVNIEDYLEDGPCLSLAEDLSLEDLNLIGNLTINENDSSIGNTPPPTPRNLGHKSSVHSAAASAPAPDSSLPPDPPLADNSRKLRSRTVASRRSPPADADEPSVLKKKDPRDPDPGSGSSGRPITRSVKLQGATRLSNAATTSNQQKSNKQQKDGSTKKNTKVSAAPFIIYDEDAEELKERRQQQLRNWMARVNGCEFLSAENLSRTGTLKAIEAPWFRLSVDTPVKEKNSGKRIALRTQDPNTGIV